MDTISIPEQVPLDLEQGNVDLQPAGAEGNSKKNSNSNEATANPQSTRDEVIRTASPVVDCGEMQITSSLASSNSVTAENGNEIEKNQNYEVHFDKNLVKESLDDRFVLSEMEKLKKFEIENSDEVEEEKEEGEETKVNNEQNHDVEMEYENTEKIFPLSEKMLSQPYILQNNIDANYDNLYNAPIEVAKTTYVDQENTLPEEDTERHEATNEGENVQYSSQKYYCKACDKLFESEQKIMLHLQQSTQNTHHQKSVMLQCEQCRKYYPGENSLQQHIKYTHNKSFFTCPECPFKTKHKSSLTTHIKSIHRGIRIRCNQCESTFATPAQLKLHDNSKHKNIRYACIKCPKTTSDQYKLKQHLLNNHGIMELHK